MAEAGDILEFDPSQKKKKLKSKKSTLATDHSTVLPTNPAATEEPVAIDGVSQKTNKPDAAAVDNGTELSLELELGKKKSRKKPRPAVAEPAVAESAAVIDNAVHDGPAAADYTYDELLFRVYDIMRLKNPDLLDGGKQRIVIKPPQLMRVGTKKTSFANFYEVVKQLHRTNGHVLQYLLTELGTTGSIDGNNQLIIKGRFQPKQIENVIRKYIKEYVKCHTCKSTDTRLDRSDRLFFLQCQTCGSRCTVASIKTGFQAVTVKRKKLRAKEG